MSTKAFLFIASILFISLSSKASTADLFAYNEATVEQQLTVATNAEAEFEANEHNISFIKEKNHLVSLVAESVDVSEKTDVGFLSFAAGCCLGLPGAAVVSLHYYYSTGNLAAGRESLKFGIIGVVVRTVAVAALYYYALSTLEVMDINCTWMIFE